VTAQNKERVEGKKGGKERNLGKALGKLEGVVFMMLYNFSVLCKLVIQYQFP